MTRNVELTYRLYGRSDIPGLLKLWKENTDWGTLTLEQWQHWYIGTPYGPCMIPVAVDQAGGIRAQSVSTPAVISFCHIRHLRAYKLTAPILDKDLRAASGSHPMKNLYAVTRVSAAADGCSLIYAFPNSTLKAFLNRYCPTLQIEAFGCVSTPLKRWAGHKQKNLAIERISEFGPDFDELWEKAEELFPIPIAVVRSSSWLRYRYGGKLTLGARNAGNELIGYAVFDSNTGLMLDCLARTRNELVAVLEGCLTWLASNCAEVGEIKAMDTPFLREMLRALDFAAHDFKFMIGREVLDPKLSLSSFDLKQWHVMPGD